MTMMWFLLFVFLAVAIVAGGLAARSYMTGEPLLGNFFAPRPERRLAVVEQAAVDNRRRLLLVRRDGVEHLIMTGGPVDVVIETGISPPPSSTAVVRPPLKADLDPAATQPAVFGRAPRNLGHVVNE